jgi:hypothetical protein
LENTAISAQRGVPCFTSSLNGFGFDIKATLEDVSSRIFPSTISLVPND